MRLPPCQRCGGSLLRRFDELSCVSCGRVHASVEVEQINSNLPKMPPIPDARTYAVTQRAWDAADLLNQGLTVAEIAREMGVYRRTVYSLLRRVRRTPSEDARREAG